MRMGDYELLCRTVERMWEYVERARHDELLLSDLGFSALEIPPKTVVVIVAGDRLHPDNGLNHLGKQWRRLADEVICSQLEKREARVDGSIHSIMNVLASDGVESAKVRASTIDRFQSSYLCENKGEVKEALVALAKIGLGFNELSDFNCNKIGEFLVVGYRENISYYLREN